MELGFTGETVSSLEMELPPPFARSAPFMCRRGNWTGSPSEAPEVTSGLRRKRKGKPPLAGGRGQGLPV